MTRTRLIACAVALAALTIQVGIVQAAGSAFQLTMPNAAAVDTSTAIELKLPANVAAVDGRIYFDNNALTFVGVAPTGAGRAMSPIEIQGGAAFGAYGLQPSKGSTTIRLIVAPSVAGNIEVHVVLDSLATSAGTRITASQADFYGVVRIAGATTAYSAPQSVTHVAPVRAATAIKTLVGQRILVHQDTDAAEVAWQSSRLNGATCGTVDAATDANGDGCIDIVDLQAVQSDLGKAAAVNPAVRMVAPSAQISSVGGFASTTTANKAAAALTFTKTFTVTYAGDTADANPGDGTCADSQGRCSLRAAMTEANWSHGSDFIGFNIPGSAPVTIAVGSSLPSMNDNSGGTTIDAYTQPGAQVNTAQYGSNAVPGVAITGTGGSPKTTIFLVQGAGNTIRGFALSRAYRPIMLDGANATGNKIIGNWIGFTASGGQPSYQSTDQVYLDAAAAGNIIGTPDLADRNVLGYAEKAIFLYGPGTDNNVIQNNDLCMTPSGGTANCSTGIDHDFGPKGTQIGGFGTNERNVIGGTLLNGVEISHGWDPNHQDTSDKWVEMNIHIEGNWIGFRMDGSYNANYRSGLNNPGTADNGNGVNVYDGCKQNVVDGNYIASAYDGINTMRPNCSSNVIQNNIIGLSPQGQAAPMSWWGIHVRLSTTDDLIQNNTISNATKGGIGLSSVESGTSSAGERYIRISRNIVSNTNGPAIYLTPTSGSGAPGSNNLYTSPVITTATTSNVSGTGIAGSTVEVYQASRSAGQSGLPSAYLGTGTVASNGTWSIPVTAAQNSRVTALEIAPNGNTSMLGTNVDVSFAPPPPAPVANFDWNQEAGNLTVDFTDTSTNTPTNWTWDFGDGSSSTLQNPTHTYASAADYSVKLTVSNGGGSDNLTRTVTVDALSGATIYAADSFGRTTSNGWSSADTGGPYSLLNNVANYSVGSGVGSMIVPSAGGMRGAFLDTISEQDVDISFAFTVDKAPAGGAYWIYAAARRNGTNEYRIKVRMLADGRVGIQASKVINNAESPIGSELIVSGLTVSQGSYIDVHAQVVGNGSTAFSINAWASGQSEPAGWQYTGGDNTAALQSAGSVGLRAYLGTNVSTAPVTFSFDDYTVIAPQ